MASHKPLRLRHVHFVVPKLLLVPIAHGFVQNVWTGFAIYRPRPIYLCFPKLWLDHPMPWTFFSNEVEWSGILTSTGVFPIFGVVSHKFWLLPSKSLGLIPNNYILRIEISKKRTARKPCKMQAPMTTCPSFEINSPYFRSFGKELTLIACLRTVHVGVAVICNYAITARTHKLPQTAGIWIFKC